MEVCFLYNNILNMIMKQLITCLLACMGLFACTAPSVTIEGKNEINRQEEFHLYCCQAGSFIPIASAPIDSNGCFHLSVPLPQEGFYLLGTERGVMHPLYLKGNETIRLRFRTKGIVLEGEQTPENQVLSQWERAATLVREHAFLYERFGGGYSTDPVTFTRELEDLLRVRQQLKPEKATDNATFNSLLKAKMEADVDFYALAYLQRNAGNLSDTVRLSNYYQEMQPENTLQQTALLQLPYAGEMLRTYVWHKYGDPVELREAFKYKSTCLSDFKFQQHYLYNEITRFRYYEQYQQLIDSVGKTFFGKSYQNGLELIEKQLAWSKPGIPAVDFKGMQPDSSSLALSELLGKVIVVDVWATWCSPCRRMMPYFKQLEKELEGEEVEFLSVCIGTSIEWDSWKEIVATEELAGHLIFINSWTKGFAKEYRIVGVPRFLIFDRKGYIVSVNAPAPNKLALKELILKTLKK